MWKNCFQKRSSPDDFKPVASHNAAYYPDHDDDGQIISSASAAAAKSKAKTKNNSVYENHQVGGSAPTGDLVSSEQTDDYYSVIRTDDEGDYSTADAEGLEPEYRNVGDAAINKPAATVGIYHEPKGRTTDHASSNAKPGIMRNQPDSVGIYHVPGGNSKISGRPESTDSLYHISDDLASSDAAQYQLAGQCGVGGGGGAGKGGAGEVYYILDPENVAANTTPRSVYHVPEVKPQQNSSANSTSGGPGGKTQGIKSGCAGGTGGAVYHIHHPETDSNTTTNTSVYELAGGMNSQSNAHKLQSRKPERSDGAEEDYNTLDFHGKGQQGKEKQGAETPASVYNVFGNQNSNDVSRVAKENTQQTSQKRDPKPEAEDEYNRLDFDGVHTSMASTKQKDGVHLSTSDEEGGIYDHLEKEGEDAYSHVPRDGRGQVIDDEYSHIQ